MLVILDFTPAHVTYPACTRAQEVIIKLLVVPQEIGFNAARRLHSHLATVLQDRHRELGSWHTRQPEPEVSVYLEELVL